MDLCVHASPSAISLFIEINGRHQLKPYRSIYIKNGKHLFEYTRRLSVSPELTVFPAGLSGITDEEKKLTT